MTRYLFNPKKRIYMSYKIEQIEGIGAAYAAKLAAAGIKTTDDLLATLSGPTTQTCSVLTE